MAPSPRQARVVGACLMRSDEREIQLVAVDESGEVRHFID